MDLFDSNSLSDDGIQVKTPTQSQENALLNDKETVQVNFDNKSENKIGDSVVNPSKMAKQTKHSSAAKRNEVILNINSSSSSLGTNQKEKKGTEKNRKNRSRSTSKRTFAKNAQARLHGNATPKRGRESGDTPPSAQQPNKFGKKSELIKQKIHKNAVTSNETKVSATPVQHNEQSIGAKNNGEFSGLQSNVSVPPATEPQLSGTEPNTVEQMDTLDKDDIVNDTETFASVVNNLCVAIVDQRSKDSITLMDQKRFDQLSSILTEKIIEHAGKNMKLPE